GDILEHWPSRRSGRLALRNARRRDHARRGRRPPRRYAPPAGRLSEPGSCHVCKECASRAKPYHVVKSATSLAPGGVEPPHADSKSAALSTELRGPAAV